MNTKLSFAQFVGRVLAAVLLVGLLFLLWQVFDVLLLSFAGLLLAVFLRTLVRLLQQWLPLSGQWAFALLLLLLLVTTGLVGWYLAPQLTQDVNQLTGEIPAAFEELTTQLANYGWAQDLLDRVLNGGRMVPSSTTLFTRITGTFSSAMNVLTNIVFVFFVGLFLAANPSLYRNGLLQLVPASRRTRMDQVINEVIITLRWWLVGQMISMSIIGILTGIALWLLGMPFALTLGIIAGLLEFVPYVGPVVTGVLAGLLAFVQSPLQAVYVIFVYMGIQQFESNILTPLVHKYTVSVAPALSLFAVLTLGALFGVVGVLVATPMVAVGVVLVKLLYIEEVLGEVPDLPRQLLDG